MGMNESLDAANINTINISMLDFRIWQHFSRNWTQPHLKKLTYVPEVPVAQHFRDMINVSEQIHSITSKDDEEDSFLICTIIKHPRTYIRTIGMNFAVCIAVYCFERFWIRPAISRH